MSSSSQAYTCSELDEKIYLSLLSTNALISEFESFGYNFMEYPLQMIYASFEARACNMTMSENYTSHESTLAYLMLSEAQAAYDLANLAYIPLVNDVINRYQSVAGKTKAIELFLEESNTCMDLLDKMVEVANPYETNILRNDKFFAALHLKALEEYRDILLKIVASARATYEYCLAALPDYEKLYAAELRAVPRKRIAQLRLITNIIFVITVLTWIAKFIFSFPGL